MKFVNSFGSTILNKYGTPNIHIDKKTGRYVFSVPPKHDGNIWLVRPKRVSSRNDPLVLRDIFRSIKGDKTKWVAFRTKPSLRDDWYDIVNIQANRIYYDGNVYTISYGIWNDPFVQLGLGDKVDHVVDGQVAVILWYDKLLDYIPDSLRR